MEFWPNRETQLCMSLSARPGNFGTRFHNFLYRKLDLNFIYKAFTTTDLAAAVGGIRALGIRGCAVSMPFKERSLEFVDEVDSSAKRIGALNTIVNTDGHLAAFNTDYIAVKKLVSDLKLSPDTRFAVRGSGGMAKAVLSAMNDIGFKNGAVIARNPTEGPRLAKTYGLDWRENDEKVDADIIINASPLGMQGSDDAKTLAFAERSIEKAKIVFDVVAIPLETPMIQKARALKKQILTGVDVLELQALEQFILYTGVKPAADLVSQATQFART